MRTLTSARRHACLHHAQNVDAQDLLEDQRQRCTPSWTYYPAPGVLTLVPDTGAAAGRLALWGVTRAGAHAPLRASALVHPPPHSSPLAPRPAQRLRRMTCWGATRPGAACTAPCTRTCAPTCRARSWASRTSLTSRPRWAGAPPTRGASPRTRRWTPAGAWRCALLRGGSMMKWLAGCVASRCLFCSERRAFLYAGQHVTRRNAGPAYRPRWASAQRRRRPARTGVGRQAPCAAS